MNRPPQVRFAGSTEECFQHLMYNSVDSLRTMEYVAEFCHTGKVGVSAVFDWWRPQTSYFAHGEQLVRLRFLLHLAGYNVAEVADFTGLVRKVSFIVAANIVDHELLRNEIYAPANKSGLWSVLVQGNGHGKKAGETFEQVVRVNGGRLDAFIKKHRPIVATLIKQPSLLAPPPPPKLPALAVPVTATAVDKMSAGLCDLLRGLIETGDIQAILLATNGGVNLKELHRLLGMIVE